MKTVNIEINGLPLQVEEGTAILNAAKEQNVKIPALCYHPDLTAWAACGICVVKLQGSGKMVRALEFLGRGDETRIAPAGDVKLNDSPCIKCGQCSAHCPVGAIYEKVDTGRAKSRKNPLP